MLTGGGDCPGLNAVIRAVTKSALHRYKLEVFGIEDGFLGLIQNRMRPLGWNDPWRGPRPRAPWTNGGSFASSAPTTVFAR